MAVEPKSGFVFGIELLSVEKQSHEQMMNSVPDVFLSLCDRHSMRPLSIAVDSPSTLALLRPLAGALGIRCERKSNLRAARRAMDSFLASMFGAAF
jgi:hypothetical protein